MHDLSILAIFKNEESFLPEWIDHYFNRNVDHLYLLNDNSNDNSLDIINQHENKKNITLLNVDSDDVHDEFGRQTYLYNKYYKYCLLETKWIGIFDLDEFCYSPLETDFKIILKEHEKTKFQELVIDWYWFGSNDFVSQPKNIVSSFVKRSSTLSKEMNELKSTYGEWCCKSISKTKNIYKLSHHFNEFYHLNNIYVSYGKDPDFSLNLSNENLMFINHYVGSKDYYFNNKVKRGSCNNFKQVGNNKTKIYNIINKNETLDTRLRDQNEQVKLNLLVFFEDDIVSLQEFIKYNYKIFNKIYVSNNTNNKLNLHYDKVVIENTNLDKKQALKNILENIGPNEWIFISYSNNVFPDNTREEIKRIEKSHKDDLFSFYKTSIENKKNPEIKISFGNQIGDDYCQIFNSSSKFLSENEQSVFSNQWPIKNRQLLNGIIYQTYEKNDIQNEAKWIDTINDNNKNIKIDDYQSIPAFVINLDERKDRLLMVDREFKHIEWPIKRIKAANYVQSPYGKLRVPEASCLDSHKTIWKHCLEKNYPFVAVFEDDVVLTSDFKNIFPIAAKELPNDWDVWHLHATKRKNIPCKSHVLIGEYVVQIRCMMWGAHGYLISKKGCEKLIGMPDNFPVDSRLSGSLYSINGNVYGIRSSSALVFQKGDDSDIQDEIGFWKEQYLRFYR